MEIVINKTIKNVKITDKHVVGVVEKVLKKAGKTKASLSINFVGEKKIRSLNKKYRKNDSITDVISFALQDGQSIIESTDLGDIFICPNQIKKQAKDFKIVEKEETIRMLVHGVLHLLGYDHKNKKDEKEMFEKQEGLVIELL